MKKRGAEDALEHVSTSCGGRAPCRLISWEYDALDDHVASRPATRRAVEWFWSAASLPAPWSIVPCTSTPLGRIRSSGRTAGGLRERTREGSSVISTTSSTSMLYLGVGGTVSLSTRGERSSAWRLCWTVSPQPVYSTF